MKKPSTSKLRASFMAIFAAFIACHPAMGLFGLFAAFPQHQDKIDRLRQGTYSLGRAVSASWQTFVEGMALGSAAFFFTLPIALLFGLPAHALLIKSGFWRTRHYALAGAFFGTVAYIYFINWTEGGLGVGFENDLHFLLGMSTGLLAAVLFRIFMGNKGNPEGFPASWHAHLYDRPNLPADMRFTPVALLCAGSGLLLTIVSTFIGALAFVAANSASLIFILFNGTRGSVRLLLEPLSGLFHPALLGIYAIQLAATSRVFTGIYIVLRRMKRTGWIAFALAGLIDGPIVYIAGLVLQFYVNYGTIAGLAAHNTLVEGVVSSAFIYAVTAIIFRGLLGHIAAKQKGRNISAPAS